MSEIQDLKTVLLKYKLAAFLLSSAYKLESELKFVFKEKDHLFCSPKDVQIDWNSNLGGGGCASVYEGEYLNNTVAIKILKNLSLELIESFLIEAIIMQSCTHQNLLELKGFYFGDYILTGTKLDSFRCYFILEKMKRT